MAFPRNAARNDAKSWLENTAPFPADSLSCSWCRSTTGWRWFPDAPDWCRTFPQFVCIATSFSSPKNAIKKRKRWKMRVMSYVILVVVKVAGNVRFFRDIRRIIRIHSEWSGDGRSIFHLFVKICRVFFFPACAYRRPSSFIREIVHFSAFGPPIRATFAKNNFFDPTTTFFGKLNLRTGIWGLKSADLRRNPSRKGLIKRSENSSPQIYTFKHLFIQNLLCVGAKSIVPRRRSIAIFWCYRLVQTRRSVSHVAFLLIQCKNAHFSNEKKIKIRFW